MADEAEYRRRADALLRAAASADNMRERGRLIDEAMHWHNLAIDASAQVGDAERDWLDDGEPTERARA